MFPAAVVTHDDRGIKLNRDQDDVAGASDD
jgi:hypothetical protein